MATEAPDPRTFKTWEDAFQYPIPVVRKLEQQLRSNADENREKLRSLVGTSYRSLLDTAETIIDMEVRMEEVEAKLARVGQNCNSRNLDRITSNAVKMDTHKRSRDQEQYTFASQLAVLRTSPVVMSRLMKSESSFLLLAKVLVIARLTHKALSQSKHKPFIVDQLWERLLSARRKLLRRINNRLASTAGDSSTLVESMCAFALATSSTPTDVLQHFHKVRRDRIVSSLQHDDDELAKHGTKALKLCIQTCQDTQTIFPRRLAESLARLKSQPLVQDPEVRGLYELNLDIHDRWIGDEARNYTPQPRHDELQRFEAEKLLHQWSRQTIAAFLKGIKAALENENRLKEVASLRQELIETWILSGSRMAGVKSANVLDNLRDTMNGHLESIVRSRTQDLKTVVSKLSPTLESSSIAQSSSQSLWVGQFPKFADVSNGAGPFKSSVVNIHQGRDNSVIAIVSAFDAWMDSVLEVKHIVKSMKEARWDDTFADDVDDSEDDDFGESKQTLLSDDDPRLLEEATQDALSNTLQSLGKSFEQLVQKLTEDEKTEVQRMCFVLRVMREIGDKIPRLRLQDKATPLPTPFTPELLKPLHTKLAQKIVRSPTQAYQKLLTTAANTKTKSHILWEGNPPLPAQPSPSAFRYLQALTKSMGDYGSDLWAPAGVAVLKLTAWAEVSEGFKENFNAIQKIAEASSEAQSEPSEEKNADNELAKTNGEPKTNGETHVESLHNAQELRDQKLKQAAFDMLYIQRFVCDSEKDNAVANLLQGAGGPSGLDEASLTRLKKSAADYAKKTYLLFALLA